MARNTGKGRVTRSISIEATRDDVIALDTLAKKASMTEGAFVRAAIDAYCGPELQRVKASFASDHSQKNEIIHEGMEAIPDATPTP